jgi:hypothetical protein
VYFPLFINKYTPYSYSNHVFIKEVQLAILSINRNGEYPYCGYCVDNNGDEVLDDYEED